MGDAVMARRVLGRAAPHPAALAVLLICAAWPEMAQAQVVPGECRGGTNQVDSVTCAFIEAVNRIGDNLKIIARNLLFSLLLIEMVWTIGRIVMSNGDFGEMMSAFIRRVLIIGLFLFFINGIPIASGQTVGIASFIILGAEGLLGAVNADALSLAPGDIYFGMIDLGREIWNDSSGFGGTVSAALVWIVLAVIGGVIAALIILAYVEIYVVFTIGIVILGFGGWQETQDFARNFLFAGVGKIFKLFTTLFVAVLIDAQLTLMDGLNSWEDGFLVIGLCIILVIILFKVPAAVEGMIASAGPSGNQAVQTGAIYAGRRVMSAGGKAGGAAYRGTKKGVGYVIRKSGGLSESLRKRVGGDPL